MIAVFLLTIAFPCMNSFVVPYGNVQVLFPTKSFVSKLQMKNDANSFNSALNTTTVMHDLSPPSFSGVKERERAKNEEDGAFNWKRQWYPVLPLKDLDALDIDKTPFDITILNQKLAVWKTSDGRMVVFDDTCPHRRTQLSTGKVCNNTLSCRYHGWEFDQLGSCVKNPMMPKDKQGKRVASKAFGVTSYPVQSRGGLLWVFMDPTISNPPELPAEIFGSSKEKNEDLMYAFNLNPISWQSMIENTFDPCHAPFTHEGGGFGGGFSPDLATPITTYNLTKKITKSGFELKHSPYQSFPGSGEVLTTRKFVAPVSCMTESPMFNSTLFFVPTRPGQTMTIGAFKMNQASKKSKVQVPQILKDLHHLLRFALGDSSIQFLNQDRIIMQGQDSRKVDENKWEDMYPTTADKGVQAMQTWARRFGRPVFTMPDKTNGEGVELSVWDRHARFCPQCIRATKLVATVASRCMLISNTSFLFSALSVFMSLFSKKAFLRAAMPLLLLSVGTRYLSGACSRTLERVFVNPSNIPKFQMADVYASA